MKREEAEKAINCNYTGIIQDYPWEKYPDYVVFRHADNRKWFALIARIKYSALNINKEGMVDIINLKAEPEMVEDLIQTGWILPAYHMNKRHWLTVMLDGSVAPEKLLPLIDLSFQLTLKKYPHLNAEKQKV